MKHTLTYRCGHTLEMKQAATETQAYLATIERCPTCRAEVLKNKQAEKRAQQAVLHDQIRDDEQQRLPGTIRHDESLSANPTTPEHPECRICGSPYHQADGDQWYDFTEDGYMPSMCRAYLRSKSK